VALLCAAVAVLSLCHAKHRIAAAGRSRSLPCRCCQWSAQPSLFRACPCQSSALLGIAVAKPCVAVAAHVLGCAVAAPGIARLSRC
jgi:hypothetical protein